MTTAVVYGGGRGGTLVRPRTQTRRLYAVRPISDPVRQIAAPYLVRGGISEMNTRQILNRKMQRIWALQDGWRGPGSYAPSPSARDFYVRCYREIAPSMLVDVEPAPTADGGLHMEWKRGRMEFSAEITRDCNLILNVYAPDDSDDREMIVERPRPWQLKDFLVKGAHGVGH